MEESEVTQEATTPIVVTGSYHMTLEGEVTEVAAIAVIKEIIERLLDYEVRQRVLAWAVRFADQHGVD